MFPVAQESDVPKKEIGSLSCVDADAVECDLSCENAITCAPLGTVRADFATKEGNSGLDAASLSNSQSHEQDPYSKMDNYESKSSFTEREARFSCHESPSPQKNQLNSPLSDSTSSVCWLNYILNPEICFPFLFFGNVIHKFMFTLFHISVE